MFCRADPDTVFFPIRTLRIICNIPSKVQIGCEFDNMQLLKKEFSGV